MSTPMNHEELVELLQEGKIGYLRFVLEGENGQDYLEWCRAHGSGPSDESGGVFVEQTVLLEIERQGIDDEDYGIWN